MRNSSRVIWTVTFKSVIHKFFTALLQIKNVLIMKLLGMPRIALSIAASISISVRFCRICSIGQAYSAIYFNIWFRKIVLVPKGIVTIHGEGASSCPALPDKKHRAFARWGNQGENSLTSKPCACFRPDFPAPWTVTGIVSVRQIFWNRAIFFHWDSV